MTYLTPDDIAAHEYDCIICRDMGIVKCHWSGWIYKPAGVLVPCHCMQIKQDTKMTEKGRIAYLKIMNMYMSEPPP